MWGDVMVSRIVYDPSVKLDERASGGIHTLYQLTLDKNYNQDKYNDARKATTTTWDYPVRTTLSSTKYRVGLRWIGFNRKPKPAEPEPGPECPDCGLRDKHSTKCPYFS